MKTHLRLPLVAFLTALFSFAFTADGWGQTTWQYDFGTTQDSHTSGVSTTFLPSTPVDGGVYRVRVGTGSGGFELVNPGTSLGSGSELQITAPANTSANKFSVYDFDTPSETAYVKFAYRTTSTTNGTLVFQLGNSVSASDNTGYTGSYNNSLAIFWINYDSGNLSTVNRRGLGSNTTISGSGFAKDTDHIVEIYGNNSASVFVYDRGGVGYSLDAQSWDIWVDGVKVSPANGWPRANNPGLAVGDLSGFTFFAENSTSNGAMIILDDLEYTNGLTAFVPTSPTILPSVTSLDAFQYIENEGPSDPESFTVSGSSLDPASGDLLVSAPTNFEVSLDDITYSSSVLIPYTGGEILNATVYARLEAGLAVNTYVGNIEISGGSAATVQISVEGNVIEPFELPYFNGLRNQDDWDEAIAYEFEFNSTSFATGAGGYVGIPNGGSIVSASIDFAEYDLIFTSFDLASLGSGGGRILTVFVSDDNGLNYTALDSYPADQGASPYITFTQYIDVSALNGSQGRIKFEMTDGTGSIRFRDLDMDFFEGYFHMDAAWFPANPDGLNIPADDVLVVNGDVAFNSNTTINALTINEGASMDVAAVLTVNGDITNNGSLVFVSNATTTGQLDTFAGAVSGDVTVQRYIPARRAFRLLSSAVTTSGSIRDNWQEGVNNPDLVTNLNPHPGFGTHITGSVTGDNGFDATPSGNPSLFTLNNATQLWEDVDNTDINTIAAGAPYRLMVRGDRSIDVTDNTATPTNTVLRTTGALHTGTFATTGFNENAGAFNFFGNPYPAIVAMNDVLAAATNVNDAHYYIWDPNLGTRGAYVTVDLPAGTNSSGSPANQYLQPGQAGFVTTLANGSAALTFEESHKAVTQPMTQVFSVVSKIDLRLYTAFAFAQSENASDAVRIKFSDDYTNAVTPMDATKFYNLDENLATSNDGILLSIEARDLPLAGETVSLFTNQYRDTNYVFEALMSELNDIQVFLKDNFTGIQTELFNNDTTLYAFQVDGNNPLSAANDRFEIVFEEMMGTNDAQFGDGFVLFPNPAQGEINIATRGIAGEEVQLSITGILGQKVFDQTLTVNADGLLTLDTAGLSNGVYILKLNHANGGQFITKFIKK